MASVDEKMADPQMNISAVPQDFFVRGIEENIGCMVKRSEQYFEFAIKGKFM